LTKSLSEGSKKRLQAEMKEVYERFLRRVSHGRNISKDAVDLNGRGKVFTGAQAKERGLVDVLGGIDVAILEATRLLGYEEVRDVSLVPFPRPRSLFQQLKRSIFSRVSDAILAEHFSRLPSGLWEISQVPVGSPVFFSTLIPHIR
jgi:protease-4